MLQSKPYPVHPRFDNLEVGLEGTLNSRQCRQDATTCQSFNQNRPLDFPCLSLWKRILGISGVLRRYIYFALLFNETKNMSSSMSSVNIHNKDIKAGSNCTGSDYSRGIGGKFSFLFHFSI